MEELQKGMLNKLAISWSLLKLGNGYIRFFTLYSWLLNKFQNFYKKNCLNYFVRFILTTVCSFSLLYSSSSLSKVPKPRASESSGNLKCKLIGSTPDLLNQKLLGWDQAICVLITLQIVLIHAQSSRITTIE